MTDVHNTSIGSDGSALVSPGVTQGVATLGAPGGDIGQEDVVSDRRASLWADAWRELRSSPIFWVSMAVILLFLTMAIAPQLFTNRDPYNVNTWTCNLQNSLKGTSPGHPMGFDFQGCDVYALTVYGARASITVGFLVVIISTIFGVTLGVLAGFYGGVVDALVSRLSDVFLGLPYVLGGIVILAVLQQPGIRGVVIALSVLGWVSTARIARSSVIQTRDADFVVAARSLGASGPRILVKYILPNTMAPVIVVSTIGLGAVVASEATFSFLGIGVQPPTLSWGQQISSASVHFLDGRHALLWPSATLSIAVLSFILLGDQIREALDPKLR